MTAKLLNLSFLKTKRSILWWEPRGSLPSRCRQDDQKLGQKADPSNFLLMHAVGANVAGQIGSVLAAGLGISRRIGSQAYSSFIYLFSEKKNGGNTST